jgi:formylglycine-generating enzyme required for sulfatase activity
MKNHNSLIIFSILLFSFNLSADAKPAPAAKKKPAAAAAQAAAPTAPAAVEKERLVILRPNVPETDQEQTAAMETALVEGLQARYQVFAGEQVSRIARKMADGEIGTEEHECDETRCLTNIALHFESELLGLTSVTKKDGNYFIAFVIRNVVDNNVVFSKSTTCRQCDAIQVIEKLKELSGPVLSAPPAVAAPVAQTAEPVAPTPAPINPLDTESLQWAEVLKGNSVDEYEAYLASYPKGKFALLAKGKIKKLKEQQAAETQRQQAQAAAERVQQDQTAWESASREASESSYQTYLNQYPQGSYVNLANARITKIRKETAANAERQAAEAQRQQAAAEQAQRELVLAQQRQARSTPSQSSGIEMVRIPGRNYEMGKFEVTQAQWRAVMGNNPSRFTACGDNCPVEQVSWNDVQEFLQKLNAKTGKNYRLPTETEWEVACYGGSQTEYCGSNEINAVAWYRDNSGYTTHPVGQKQANGYGLYDMSGNVWEWMSDCYDASCEERVLRGGSWDDIALISRAVHRSNMSPAFRLNYYGFRLARTLP